METIIIAILGCSAFNTIVNAIIEHFRNKAKEKKEAEKERLEKDKGKMLTEEVIEAIKYSLLYCLQAYGEKLKEKGQISAIEYKQFIAMYTVYKAIGGDGFADVIKEIVDRLPREL